MTNELTRRQRNWLEKVVDETFWQFRYDNTQFDARKNGVFQMRKALCQRSVIDYVYTIEEYNNHIEFVIKYHNVALVVIFDNDETNSLLWSIETFDSYAKHNLCPDEVIRILNFM